jgi:membrane protein YqaA with SNARE-associated domain
MLDGSSAILDPGFILKNQWAIWIGFYILPDFTLFLMASQSPEWLFFWTGAGYFGSLLNGWSVYGICRWGRSLLEKAPWIGHRLNQLSSSKTYALFEGWMHRYGAWAIIIGSSLHVSYLSMMTCAGLSHMPAHQVIWGCVWGRALRFATLGLLIGIFGAVAKDYLPYLPFIAIGTGLCWWGYKKLRKPKAATSNSETASMSLTDATQVPDEPL